MFPALPLRRLEFGKGVFANGPVNLRRTVAQSVFARITLRNEIAGNGIVDLVDLDVRVRAGERYAAAESLSCRVTKLRRGNGNAVADFFG
ncbi:MAG: hypothetical protein DMC60_03450 [Verrucomicrobia bacterium]|nr:MAG: hypothetical protein DMC60_03450 [Verrucomicrobiota bacterium]